MLYDVTLLNLSHVVYSCPSTIKDLMLMSMSKNACRFGYATLLGATFCRSGASMSVGVLEFGVGRGGDLARIEAWIDLPCLLQANPHSAVLTLQELIEVVKGVMR